MTIDELTKQLYDSALGVLNFPVEHIYKPAFRQVPAMRQRQYGVEPNRDRAADIMSGEGLDPSMIEFLLKNSAYPPEAVDIVDRGARAESAAELTDFGISQIHTGGLPLIPLSIRRWMKGVNPAVKPMQKGKTVDRLRDLYGKLLENNVEWDAKFTGKMRNALADNLAKYGGAQGYLFLSRLFSAKKAGDIPASGPGQFAQKPYYVDVNLKDPENAGAGISTLTGKGRRHRLLFGVQSLEKPGDAVGSEYNPSSLHEFGHTASSENSAVFLPNWLRYALLKEIPHEKRARRLKLLKKENPQDEITKQDLLMQEHWMRDPSAPPYYNTYVAEGKNEIVDPSEFVNLLMMAAGTRRSLSTPVTGIHPYRYGWDRWPDAMYELHKQFGMKIPPRILKKIGKEQVPQADMSAIETFIKSLEDNKDAYNKHTGME